MSKYEIIIGLEIHLQLNTKTKMFCSCLNNTDDKLQNSLVCPICLGHPGTLPTPNKEAINQAIALGLALNCQINKKSKFDRKHYFYPDLPKGYQISQFDEPIVSEGYLVVYLDNKKEHIGLERIHLEEDAAKNIHHSDKTLIDYNRGGTPLAEIVTKPDFRSPKQTKEFLQSLRLISRYLDISDADMEKGHLRCDANISLRPKGDNKYYSKTEIKNLNSFKAVEKALEFEVKRQKKLWDDNNAPKITTTRGWDEKKKKTIMHRSKEGSADYRYFPEPDIPPIMLTDKLIKFIESSMPELPADKKDRFVKEYSLDIKEAALLINYKEWSDYYEDVMSELRAWLFKSGDIKKSNAEKLWQENKKVLSKLSFNWLISELFGLLNNTFIFKDLKINPENMAELIYLIYTKKVSSSAGQTILKEMFIKGSDPSYIAEEKDLLQIEDESLSEDLVEKVLRNNKKQVEEYKSGKDSLLKFFIGQVMKESRGKANPKTIEDILLNKLK